MTSWIQPVKVALLISGLAAFFSNEAGSQTVPPTFQRGVTYISAIEELDTKYAGLRASGLTLIAERQDAITRLLETQKVLSQIADANAVKAFELAYTELMTVSKQAEMNAFIATQKQTSPLETGIDVRNDPARQLRAQIEARQQKGLVNPGAIAQYGNEVARGKVQYDFLLHQMKTLNAAGKLAAERHVSILRELEKIVNDMLLWDSKTKELFRMYWSLADVEGVKSNFELRAALHQLTRSSNENPGALLLKSITLVRLEAYEDAIPILNQLFSVPELQVLVTLIRAEVLARTGKQREALAELRKVARFGLNDPRVHMHRAMTLSACDEFRQAEAEWETILKLGEHEVAARRAIAFINAAAASPTDRTKSKAMENAQLAAKLDEADWASKLAFALATAAKGDTDEGATLATEAAELAVDSNQILCDEIAEQLLAGKMPSWKFK